MQTIFCIKCYYMYVYIKVGNSNGNCKMQKQI